MAEKTDAQKRAQKAYMEKFVRVEIRMNAEQRAAVQAHAEAQGQSVNAYINTAIDERMSREAVGTPTRPTDAMTSKDIAEDEDTVLDPSEGRREGNEGGVPNE